MMQPSPRFPLAWLYLDTNTVHYYRIGRARDPQKVSKLNSIFEDAEHGRVKCATSAYTRFEMINFAKKAEYALQELEAGRTDIGKILEETRASFKVSSERMAKRCREIDEWFLEQERLGHLELLPAEDVSITWRLAETLVEQTGIAGMGDCLHVATAIVRGCSIFVTEDQSLRKGIQQELCAESSSREAVQQALFALTGSENLSIEPRTIDTTHVWIGQELEKLKNAEGTGNS